MPYRLLLFVIALALMGGCRWISLKAGWGYTVTEAEEESPEWVVQQMLRAAQTEPFEAAWENYRKYLHSDETSSPVALRDWETLRFPALRRKHRCYLREDGVSFVVMEEVEGQPNHLQLRVKCKTSDVPTPCHLFTDKAQGGKWRVKINCLN